jgi:hypothetical protein
VRKLVLLVGLCMLGVLTVGGVAGAQTSPENIEPDPYCPAGSVQNAAGTTCTDYETGEIVAEIPNPNASPQTNPCPEMWAMQPDGTCAPIDPVTGEVQAPHASTATATPGPVEPLTAAPAATATATATADATGGTAALPETGGLVGALSLAALGLLVAGGLISARIIRR